MTDLALPSSRARFARGSTARALAALLLLVATGDWLCFALRPGAGVAIFAGCIIAAVFGTAVTRPTAKRLIIAAIIVLPAQLPWLLAPDALAFGLSLLGTASAAACLSGVDTAYWPRTRAILGSLVWRIAPDLFRAWPIREPSAAGTIGPAALLGWILPALGGMVFLGLFADANPIISSSLSAASPQILLQALTLTRLLFWLALASMAWPFLVPPALPATGVPSSRTARSGTWRAVFGTLPISRALILFNLLFAIQTGLDAAYLWGGATLPRGLTYAAYAHRGAYPLILTALLAGGFAILATRPGSAPAVSRSVRLLVLLWIAQNLALVGSSILRLCLYVQVYSLSELRLASFIWMLLVFVGLVLIILRILWVRSDAWLLRANGFAGVFTLYIFGCLNFPWIVAQYDVTHCREVTGSGEALDLDYLQGLGPQAIPALDRYQLITSPREATLFAQRGAAATTRVMLAANFSPPTDWRSFSIWSWVLQSYLVAHDTEAPLKVSPFRWRTY